MLACEMQLWMPGNPNPEPPIPPQVHPPTGHLLRKGWRERADGGVCTAAYCQHSRSPHKLCRRGTFKSYGSVRPLTYPPRALGKAAVNTTALAVHVLAAAAACSTRSAAHGTRAQGQGHCDCMQAGPCTIWRLRTGMTNAGTCGPWASQPEAHPMAFASLENHVAS